jgi:uncharacterized phage protein (TIGR02220 family)
MARNKNWFRVYDRMIDSPEILELNDTEFRLIVSLWCIASAEGQEGNISLTDASLNKRTMLGCSIDTLQSMIEHLKKLDLLSGESGSYSIPRWMTHQYEYKSKIPSNRNKGNSSNDKAKQNDTAENEKDLESNNEDLGKPLGSDGEANVKSLGSDGEANVQVETDTDTESDSDNIYSAEQLPVNNVDNVDNVHKPNNKQMPYNEIIDYLNLKAGTSYRSASSKTKALIKARYNEKFTIDDFKSVIDKKVLEWKGTEFEKFLRPETLFGPKFESYLNQPQGKNNKSSGDTAIDYDGHPYSRQKMQNICDRLLGRKAEEGRG